MATTAHDHHARRHSRLRLLQGRSGAAQPAAPAVWPAADAGVGEKAHLHILDEDPPRGILVAASDARRRGRLLRELSQRLPQGTPLTEAAATWEVLEQAPHSRLVMLAGELDGSSTESVMHLLGNRHPQLPVLTLGASAA